MNTALRTLVPLALLAAWVPGQDGDAAATALARARVIEEQEGDLAAAESAYRALLGGDGAAAVHSEAALRLGSLLWRLDRKDDAKPWLERAAQAGGAIGEAAQAILQGKGQDGAQAAPVAANVKAALDGWGQRTRNPDLMWLGEAAVPALCRELDALRAAVASARSVGDPSVALETIAVSPTPVLPAAERRTAGGLHRALVASLHLWAIGGADADRYLRAGATDPEPAWRRLLAFGARQANDGLAAVLDLYLRDTDPSGIVAVEAIGAAPRIAVASLATAMASPITRVRGAALRAFGDGHYWSQRAATFAAIEASLRRALADADVARAAFELLCAHAGASTAAAELLLDWLPRVPVFTAGQIEAPPSLSSVARAARALGPMDTDDSRTTARRHVASAARVSIHRSDDVTAAPILDLRRAPRPQTLLQVLSRADIAIDADDLLAILANAKAFAIPGVLATISRPAAPEVVRAVEAKVADPDAKVRAAACATLGRLLAAESATPLLGALGDRDEDVRAAATDALQRIKLFHEQAAFWQQVQQGISTGRAAAAAKLLAQGKPGEPKEQRVLAIRSLGALGAPEALPYLIDWTKDADADVAAAARAAVAQIRQAGGAPK